MRKYKDKAVLSLNPILDIVFLDTNHDGILFPSVNNKFKEKKSQSMKHLKKQQRSCSFKLKHKQEMINGFNKTHSVFDEFKNRQLSLFNKKTYQMQKRDQSNLIQLLNKNHRAPQNLSSKMSFLYNKTQSVIDKRRTPSRLRQTIDESMFQNRSKKGGMFNIIISSYRDFD